VEYPVVLFEGDFAGIYAFGFRREPGAGPAGD
jgi:hypothetical protein